MRIEPRSFARNSSVASRLTEGERIRIDISSSAFPWYVRHTNNKGLYSIQESARIAKNTVILDKSYVTLPYLADMPEGYMKGREFLSKKDTPAASDNGAALAKEKLPDKV